MSFTPKMLNKHEAACLIEAVGGRHPEAYAYQGERVEFLRLFPLSVWATFGKLGLSA